MWTEETEKRLEEVLTPEMGFPLQADIRAALEEIERLKAREAKRLAEALEAFSSTTNRLVKTLNHRTIERDEARAKLAKLREALREWVPPHSAACCMPDPGSGTFPAGPLKPDWCRCDERVKRTRAALAEEVS